MPRAKRQTDSTAKKKKRKLSGVDWKPLFLRSLAGSGNISVACKRARIGRTAFYHQRDNDEKFAAAVKESLEQACDQLEAEAKRRAHDGVKEPVFYKGEVCGHIQRYSDTLLIFLLKAHRPEKYRERYVHEHSGPAGGPIELVEVVQPSGTSP